MNKILSYILIFFLFSACQEKKDENTLIVATSADNPPYEFIDNGKVVGIDIDIINEIGKEIGKKIIIKNMDFQGLLAALGSGKVDLIAAGMSVTEERKKQVSFSSSYTKARVAVIFKNDKNFKLENDLREAKIGVQLGTFWNQIANIISLDKEENVKALNNNLTLVQELKNGTIDAVIMEEYQAKKFRKKYNNLNSFVLDKYNSEFAFVLPKNSSSHHLIEEINAAIDKITKNKVISTIEDKWLGVRE